ncbi:MAG TPA: glutamyl-tRNA reductase [Steroidobacteraceae bacterium]|nr:glutamyl-tRNA reductase [Steroidobacteraceae bacterium]
MSLLVLGLNHRTAPIDVRERIVFSAERLPEALAALNALPGIQEALIVSTCNRTELYCVTEAGDAPLSAWLAAWSGGDPALADCLYRLEGADAVRHVFSVASGLDSLILGEPQILGQLKDAYRAAQRGGTAGAQLNRLFQTTFSVAKRVRTETAVGASAVSVASAGIQLARRIFSGFEQHTALLVGAGDMIELAARHLHAQKLGQMIIANRSLNRAQRLAGAFKASAISLDALDSHLAQADIVVSSTASPDYVIGFEATRAATAKRLRRPIFMLDLAVPRDIDPRVAELEDVYLFTIDDLRQVVDVNVKARQEEAETARVMVAAEVERYVAELKVRDAVPLIRELRGQAEIVRSQTLEQARRMIASGRPPEEVLEFLAATLTNRLLHGPSVALREAAESDDAELAALAARLFRLGNDAP